MSEKKWMNVVMSRLEPGERVLGAVKGRLSPRPKGSYRDCNGLLAGTDRRLLFAGTKFLAAKFESFPYPQIRGFQAKTSGVKKWIKFGTPGLVVTVDYLVWRGDAFQQLLAAIPPAAREVNAPPVQQQMDPVDQLRRLHDLLQQGAISQDDYDRKKAQLLGL